MATDPTRRIRQFDHDTEFTLEVEPHLKRLGALPPSTDVPYVTVNLDWRMEGTNPGRSPSSGSDDDGENTSARRRPAFRIFEEEMGAAIDARRPRGPIFDSLSADAERITSFLESELDPAANGVVIVSCSANDVFEYVTLATPVPTGFRVGPTPSLTELVRVAGDHPTYAVLLADQHDAYLSFIKLAASIQSVVLESSGYPRKQQQGGWSQRRFQARADERVNAFARDIAEETQKALDSAGVEMLIIAGDEVITSALDDAFHPSVKDRIVGQLRLDIRTGEHELIAETQPVAEQAARDRETAIVERLQNAVGAGGQGASGAEDTLIALQAGQVDILVMNDDFSGTGWVDYSLPTCGVGAIPEAHPLGGDPNAMVPVTLEDEFVRLALQSGASVVIIHSDVPVPDKKVRDLPDTDDGPPRTAASATLWDHGGVGALLRYVMDEEATPEHI